MKNKNKLLYVVPMVMSLLACQTFASNELIMNQEVKSKGVVLQKGSTINDILSDPNTALSRMEVFSKESPNDARDLCKTVMLPESKFLDKAKEANMKNLKALEFMRYCDNYKEETALMKKVEQKDIQQKKIELPKLNPVNPVKKTEEKKIEFPKLNPVNPVKKIEEKKIEFPKLNPVNPVKKVEEKKIEFPKLNPVNPVKKTEEKKIEFPKLNPVNPVKKTEEKKIEFTKLKPVEKIEDKIVEPKFEFPKLKPVKMTQQIDVSNITIASNEIAENKKEMLQNVQKLEESNIQQKMELEKIKQQINETQKLIETANEHYNNLAIAVSIIREDMKSVKGFEVFNPLAHDNDTNEEYLSAFNEQFSQEKNKWVLDKYSLEQIDISNQLLLEAKKNLLEANKRLLILNEEMLKLK